MTTQRITEKQAQNERYQENLERQAEDIFRSWGLVEKSDGSWRKPEKKRPVEPSGK